MDDDFDKLMADLKKQMALLDAEIDRIKLETAKLKAQASPVRISTTPSPSRSQVPPGGYILSNPNVTTLNTGGLQINSSGIISPNAARTIAGFYTHHLGSPSQYCFDCGRKEPHTNCTWNKIWQWTKRTL